MVTGDWRWGGGAGTGRPPPGAGWARRWPPGRVAGLALAGVAGCVAATVWYLAEYPSTATLPIHHLVTLRRTAGLAVVLAALDPTWLPRPTAARRRAMALVLAAGFVLSSRLALRGVAGLDAGMMGYVLLVSPLVVLTGSAAAAAAGRSFRSGLAAAAWATVLGGLLVVVAWLAEAPHWYRQGRGLLLDGEGAGGGANLGDAVWWTLIVLALWALPLGVIGAAAGGARARRRRARAQAELA